MRLLSYLPVVCCLISCPSLSAGEDPRTAPGTPPKALQVFRNASAALSSLRLAQARAGFQRSAELGFPPEIAAYWEGITLLSALDKPAELMAIGDEGEDNGNDRLERNTRGLLLEAAHRFAFAAQHQHDEAKFVCSYLERYYPGSRCPMWKNSNESQDVSISAQLQAAYEQVPPNKIALGHGDNATSMLSIAAPDVQLLNTANGALAESETEALGAAGSGDTLQVATIDEDQREHAYKRAYDRYSRIAQQVMGQKADGMLPFEQAEQVSLYNDNQIVWKKQEKGWLDSLYNDLSKSGKAKADAARNLGNMHMDGQAELRVNPGLACAYFEIAYEENVGDPGATSALADCYRYGWGRVGARQALDAELQARASANELVQNPMQDEDELAQRSKDGSKQFDSTKATNNAPPPKVNVNAKAAPIQNATRASELYEQAIGFGSVQALVGLASMQQEGIGMEQNISAAASNFAAAAEAGNVNGIMSLGMLHFAGWLNNTHRNMSAALVQFRRAAKAGHLNAHFYSSLILSGAMGGNSQADTNSVTVSWSEALHHARAVAENGLHGDFKRLYGLVRADRPLAAFVLYEMKAAQGFPIAQRNAAFLLDKLKADGQGTARFVGGWGAVSAKPGERHDVVHPGLRAMAHVACGSVVDRAQRVHIGAHAPAGAGGGTCETGANEKLFATLRSRVWMSRAAAQGSIDAMVMLGDSYYYGEHSETLKGEGDDGAFAPRAPSNIPASQAAAAHRAVAAQWYVRACRASAAGMERSRADWRGLAADARARWNLAWMHMMGMPMARGDRLYRSDGENAVSSRADASGALESEVDLDASLHFLTESLKRDRTGLATVLQPILQGGGTQVLAIWRRMLLWLPGSDTDPMTMAKGLLKHLGISWGQ